MEVQISYPGNTVRIEKSLNYSNNSIRQTKEYKRNQTKSVATQQDYVPSFICMQAKRQVNYHKFYVPPHYQSNHDQFSEVATHISL